LLICTPSWDTQIIMRAVCTNSMLFWCQACGTYSVSLLSSSELDLYHIHIHFLLFLLWFPSYGRSWYTAHGFCLGGFVWFLVTILFPMLKMCLYLQCCVSVFIMSLGHAWPRLTDVTYVSVVGDWHFWKFFLWYNAFIF